MGTSRTARKKLRVKALALALVVCVWLIPTATVLAASGSFTVSVTVVESLEVSTGEKALSQPSGEFIVTEVYYEAAAAGMEGTVPADEGAKEDFAKVVRVTASKL